MRRLAAALVVCGLVACSPLLGLDAYGIDDATDAGGARPNDATPTVPNDASSVDPPDLHDGGGTLPDADAATNACDAAAGAAGVTFLLPDNGAPWPAGASERVVHMDPEAGAGTCSCGACTPTALPSCAGNGLQYTWSVTPSCSGIAYSYNVSAANPCTKLSTGSGAFSRGPYERVSNRTPQAGTCTVATLVDAAKVTSATQRACTPTTDAAFCALSAARHRMCVASPDGGACAAPFSSRVVVGDGAKADCGACACAHTGTGCEVELHGGGDDTCTGAVRGVQRADGVCAATNGAGNIEYGKVQATNVTCTTTPGTATASLTNERTLCCTP